MLATYLIATVTVDHTNIPADDLRIARWNADRAPWTQTFTWIAACPTAGMTVYSEGKLWTVYDRERGANEGMPSSCVSLIGCGHDDEFITTLDNCRPVTWTQDDEDAFQDAQRRRFVAVPTVAWVVLPASA